MAWTSPMTAVAGGVLTAAQWNVHIRDNLNACAPGAATAGGRWIVSTGWYSLTEREPQVAYIGTADTTDSTSFTDLSSLGPAISTETATKAIVTMGARVSNTTAGHGGKVTVEVSGATSLSASDLNAYYAESGNANDQFKGSWCTIYDPLEAGTNVFTLKYRAVGGGTAQFADRLLMVISF